MAEWVRRTFLNIEITGGGKSRSFRLPSGLDCEVLIFDGIDSQVCVCVRGVVGAGLL